MAKAKLIPPPVPVKSDIQLTLNEDEAQFLIDLLGRYVVGSPERSRRKYSDAIWRALTEEDGIGLEYDLDRAHNDSDLQGNSIRFKDIF